MTSEWMKVMLEEIERKKAEAEQARLEQNGAREERERRARRCSRADRSPSRDDPAQG